MSRKIGLIIFQITLLLEGLLIAGPTIIRDSRITDLAMTPTLGRGYTIVTNTFQSKCLDNIALTDPSYDFQYKFESIDTSSAAHMKTATSFGLEVPLQAVTVGASGSSSVGLATSEHKHHIYVEINMDTYYASVDEAQTRLGSSAGLLLTNNDIPGFFSSCGSYYVRSLGRNAKFISIYTYSDKSSTRDASFESSLKVGVTGFGSAEAGVSGELMQQAGEKKLSIIARAYGLGKNEGASLISYDIETFKAAVKDAFISMQNPMTGKITTMEIVPWVENTEFQSLIALEKEIPDPKTGKTMLLYKKKQILNQNAEYLAEIERADRNRMNIYYKAKICRQNIEANWMQGVDKIHPDFANAEIANNKFPSEKMTLETLLKQHLTIAKIEGMLSAEEEFMYGADGANVCIMKMLDSGMFVKSYRDIPECVKLRGNLSAVLSTTIDNYCMPELAKKPVLEPQAQATTPTNTQ